QHRPAQFIADRLELGAEVQERDRCGLARFLQFDHASLSSCCRRACNRAGIPTTTEFAGTSCVTTAPAPTVAPGPMVTPQRMIAPLPIDAPRQTRVGTTCQS